MTITYTWEFPTLRVKLNDSGLQNVVYLIDWTYAGENINNIQSYLYGQVSVGLPDPAKFTPFDQLTKLQVQGWVEPVLGADQIAAMRKSIELQIQNIINPTDAPRQPPWIKS